jgi:hypothetical protein
MRHLFIAAILAPLAACAAVSPSGIVSHQSRDWRQAVTDGDRDRLRDWREAWIKGLRQASAAGYANQVAAEGALLQPDMALAAPSIPNGRYRCRMIKLGAKSEGLLPFIAGLRQAYGIAAAGRSDLPP